MAVPASPKREHWVTLISALSHNGDARYVLCRHGLSEVRGCAGAKLIPSPGIHHARGAAQMATRTPVRGYWGDPGVSSGPGGYAPQFAQVFQPVRE